MFRPRTHAPTFSMPRCAHSSSTPGGATFLAVHLLPRVCGEEPLEQLRTTNAKRIIETLVRPSGVTIKRYSKRADADFRHALNLNVGDADVKLAHPDACFGWIVGYSEVGTTFISNSVCDCVPDSEDTQKSEKRPILLTADHSSCREDSHEY
jgi:hypothetical protein